MKYVRGECAFLLFWSSLCLPLVAGCGKTAQLGGDEECLAAADALWTAVTAKRSDLLETSAAEIEKLHAAAKLPHDAFDSLSSIVETARAGRWAEARVALKSFVRGQRPAPVQ